MFRHVCEPQSKKKLDTVYADIQLQNNDTIKVHV